MTQYLAVPLVAFWAAFGVYWVLSARHLKKNVRSFRSWASLLAVYAVIASVILAVSYFIIRAYGAEALSRYSSIGGINPACSIAGLVMCALGLAFAAWARAYLGKNWGIPMTVKEGAELVTTGPYRFVRHPIYSGVLLGFLGSALVGGMPWLIAFVIFAIYFALSARAEEHLMVKEFPDQYPEYQKRTQAFIPFVW